MQLCWGGFRRLLDLSYRFVKSLSSFSLVVSFYWCNLSHLSLLVIMHAHSSWLIVLTRMTALTFCETTPQKNTSDCLFFLQIQSWHGVLIFTAQWVIHHNSSASSSQWLSMIALAWSKHTTIVMIWHMHTLPFKSTVLVRFKKNKEVSYVVHQGCICNIVK